MRTKTRSRDDDLAALAAVSEDEIDTSDIPEITDWSGALVGHFYRPKKQPVTLRLDADVLAWFRSRGRGYQTEVNRILREHVAREAGAARATAAAGSGRRGASRRRG